MLDPFAGSGTTGVAALMEGRDFLGAELDGVNCEIARCRMEDVVLPSEVLAA
jgi:site-specific DNA-methyltransferase (adenine-specific)